MTTDDRIRQCKAEMGILRAQMDSCDARWEAQAELLALLEEKDNRERLGVVC